MKFDDGVGNIHAGSLVVVVIGDRVGLGDHLRELGATVYEEFREADAVGARAGAVVYIPPIPSGPQPLAEIDESDWDTGAELPLRSALHVCRAALDRLRDRGGAIILVTPTAGLVGEAGFVGIATATEGMRSLAKSAARQWGQHGITVNCVAPSLALLGAAVAPGVEPPALGRTATVEDLARTIAVLAGDAARSITGATVPVDGGVVMLP